MITIKFENNETILPFRRLHVGSAFIWTSLSPIKDTLFVKTENGKAVRLPDGMTCNFLDSDSVRQVDLEITVKRYPQSTLKAPAPATPAPVLNSLDDGDCPF